MEKKGEQCREGEKEGCVVWDEGNERGNGGEKEEEEKKRVRVEETVNERERGRYGWSGSAE